MLRYAVKRVLLTVPTLLGITLITFLVMQLAPGDPAAVRLGQAGGGAVSPETYARLRDSYGLDQPVWWRYGLWLRQVVCLDFGRSYHDGRRVTDKILERLPATVSLSVGAMFLALAIALPVGLLTAAWRGGVIDAIAGTATYALYAIPRYVMGMLLIVVVGVRWGWLPFHGVTSDDFELLSPAGKMADLARHFALIVICFAYPLVAYQSRFVRSNLLEVLGQDFIRTARAKGLSERTVLCKHALRNTLIPLITMLGMLLPTVLGGSVILESMFGWPGMGQLLFQALLQRDYPTIMGLSVVSAVLVLLGTLLADLAYGLADPRVRYE